MGNCGARGLWLAQPALGASGFWLAIHRKVRRNPPRLWVGLWWGALVGPKDDEMSAKELGPFGSSGGELCLGLQREERRNVLAKSCGGPSLVESSG